MIKRSKLVYILGSAIIGIVSIIFIFAGLILSGVIDHTPSTLVVESSSKQVIYDGQVLTCNEWKLVDGKLKEGHSADVIFTGSQTNVGESDNTFALTVLDRNGADVSADYTIVYKMGVLSVSPRPLTVQAGSAAKEYDGTPLRESSFEIISGELIETHLISADALGEISDVGMTENVLQTTIRDAEGTDVTPNYEITELKGTLTVTPRKLILQSGSDSKIYDTTPLVKEEYTIIQGSLAGGQRIEADYLSSLTDVDTIQNKFTVEIFTATDTCVTNNYEISYEYGELVVYTKEIRIATESYSKIYDGTPLMWDEWNLVEGDVFDGHTLSVYCNGVVGSGTDGKLIGSVGEAPNTAKWEVVDQDDEDVTFNYSIILAEENTGKLEILPRPVQILETNSASKTYDGQPFDTAEYHGYTLKPSDLYSGLLSNDDLDVSYVLDDTISNFINVDEKGNEIKCKVIRKLNGETHDVSANYEIRVQSVGKVTIEPVRITIKSKESWKNYDGQPLTCEQGTVTCKDMYDNTVDISQYGHQIIPQYKSSITEAGETENKVVEWKLCDLSNQELDDKLRVNYVLDADACEWGKLEVRKKAITVQTSGASKTYDGNPLYGNQSSAYNKIVAGELASGHSISFNFSWQGYTDAGVYEHTATAIIKDSNNKDVTSNYDISYDYGTLRINPRPITIESMGASKVYDGTPLTNNAWKYASTNRVISGHTITVRVTGSRTVVGESPNTISEISISNGYDNVTDNYNITKIEGSLIIIGQPSYSQLASNTGGSNLADTNTDRTKVVARVKSDATGRVYLKQKSEGAYNGSGWNAAVGYVPAQYIDGQYGMDYLGGIALEADGDFEAQRLQIEMVERVGYMLPYYMKKGEFVYSIQKSDVLYAGGADFKYSMYYYPYSYQGGSTPRVPTAYSAYEKAYKSHVESEYTKLNDADTEAYLNAIIASKAWTKATPGIISKVARYIQGVATYNLDYNRALDSSTEVVIDFFNQKEGVCRHFASAATAMYRVLGIPARYTVGFVVNTKAGEYVDVTYAQAHAWVEVYVSGFGWVQVEVTGSNSGVLDDPTESAALQVYPKKQEVQGSSSTVLKATQEITGNDAFLKLLNEGYWYEVHVSGEQKGIGKGISIIDSFTLYNSNDEDVTDNYSIEKFTGVLHVYSSQLTIYSGSQEQVYNGQLLTLDGYSVSGALPYGYYLDVKITGEQLNVGMSANTFTAVVKDGAGNDVTDQFKIDCIYGTLIVTKADVILKTHDAVESCDWNSTERFTYHSAEIIGDLGPNLEVVTFDRSAYLYKNVTGSCTNKATLKIIDTNGEDVTKNYNITYVYGTLSII